MRLGPVGCGWPVSGLWSDFDTFQSFAAQLLNRYLLEAASVHAAIAKVGTGACLTNWWEHNTGCNNTGNCLLLLLVAVSAVAPSHTCCLVT